MEHGRATTLGMSCELRHGYAIGWDWSQRGRGACIEWSRRRGRSDHQTRKLATQAPDADQANYEGIETDAEIVSALKEGLVLAQSAATELQMNPSTSAREKTWWNSPWQVEAKGIKFGGWCDVNVDLLVDSLDDCLEDVDVEIGSSSIESSEEVTPLAVTEVFADPDVVIVGTAVDATMNIMHSELLYGAPIIDVKPTLCYQDQQIYKSYLVSQLIQRGVRLGARMKLPKSDPWRKFPSVTYVRGRAHSFQGWDIHLVWGEEQLTAQSFRRVLLGAQQRVRRRPRSRPDTEADSLDDLDLDDLDEKELDDLFETYGEVVRGESAPTPNSPEADDDAESLALAVALAEVANEVKASEIRVLCVKPLVYWTRFFVIATGFSRPQVDAIAERMRNMAEERFKRTPRGDLKPNSWTLLDFGDVVVHIFYPQERSFYNLEEFYGNAISVELPFESQSQVR